MRADQHSSHECYTRMLSSSFEPTVDTGSGVIMSKMGHLHVDHKCSSLLFIKLKCTGREGNEDRVSSNNPTCQQRRRCAQLNAETLQMARSAYPESTVVAASIRLWWLLQCDRWRRPLPPGHLSHLADAGRKQEKP